MSDSVGSTKDFFGLITMTAIASIEIRVLDPNGWGLDNLFFGEAAAIPEPATLLLLGTGLAAAGMRRRMKKRG